jgi:hypothetical protein
MSMNYLQLEIKFCQIPSQKENEKVVVYYHIILVSME